jgi:hypothetical protein
MADEEKDAEQHESSGKNLDGEYYVRLFLLLVPAGI